MSDSVLSMVVTPIITHKSRHDVTSKGKHYSFKIGPCCGQGVHVYYTLEVERSPHPLALMIGSQKDENDKKVEVTAIERNIHPHLYWWRFRVPMPFFLKWRVERAIKDMKTAFTRAEALEKKVNALRDELEKGESPRGIEQQSL